MTTIPAVSPPLPTPNKWARSLTPLDPVKWLTQGWRDFTTVPAMSIAYGVVILFISVGLVGGLIALGRDYILFPAFAGFMVVGPILAVGLYEKSRRIEENLPLRWSDLFFIKPRSGGQILFTGVLLCLTIIGIPLGLANFKLIPISLFPLGREIVGVDQARAIGAEAQVTVPSR